MLVMVPARKRRHEIAAGVIQNLWYDYLDRKEAKRELYRRRVLRKMGVARLQRKFVLWRTRTQKLRRLRQQFVRSRRTRELSILLKWSESTRQAKARRQKILENAVRQMRLRHIEMCFEKWWLFSEKSKTLKQFVWERMKRETLTWFNRWYNSVFAARIARERKRAAICIQKVARGRLGRNFAREKYKRDTAAALLLQRVLRARFARVILKRLRALAKRKMQRKKRKEARAERYTGLKAKRREQMATRREQILAELGEILKDSNEWQEEKDKEGLLSGT